MKIKEFIGKQIKQTQEELRRISKEKQVRMKQILKDADEGTKIDPHNPKKIAANVPPKTQKERSQSPRSESGSEYEQEEEEEEGSEHSSRSS